MAFTGWRAGIAERKVRRTQLTDDGNVETTGRDLRERKCGQATHAPSAIAGPLDESRAAWRSATLSPSAASKQFGMPSVGFLSG